MAKGRPFVTLKLATSLDGRIATASGESRWITGEEARAEAHRLRAAHDAVLVGAGTVRADDPELTARTEPAPARQPMRVAVASGFDVSPTARLFETRDKGPVVVLGRSDALTSPACAALAAAGVQVGIIESAGAGVDLALALQLLAENRLSGFGHDVNSVLVEGGGRIAASLVAGGLVDRLEWFRAPIVLGEEGRPAMGPLGLGRLADAPRFRRVAARDLGHDLWETYTRV